MNTPRRDWSPCHDRAFVEALVNDVREAAFNIMDLAGQGTFSPDPRDTSVRAWLISRRRCDGGTFHAVGLRIFGYWGQRLGQSREDKVLRAALAAAAAELHETGVSLEIVTD